MGGGLPVYLPHWHTPGWCRSAADSILASCGSDVHLTVINNGGELNLPDEVDVVSIADNVGFSGAVNVGLRQWLSSTGEWCVVGAHDLQVQPDALRRGARRHLDLRLRLGRLESGAVLILRPSLRGEGLYRLRAFPRGFRLLFSRESGSNQR